MKENNIALEDKIRCPKCNYIIALRNLDDNTVYIPSDIKVKSHEFNKDTMTRIVICRQCRNLVKIISR